MRILVLALAVISSLADGHCREIIERILEPAILEVRYERRKVLDTLDMENDFRQDFLTLKVGKTVSAFYSAELKTSDSIGERHPEVAMSILDDYELFKQRGRLPKEKVFKNYPRGKVRVHDRFDLCNWLIDEEWETQSWTVSDSVRNIMGHDCLLARTDFRGRHWEAWFSPDIPISDGPWKLCGLPGLILEARDNKGHYVYEAVSIRTENVGNVEYYDYEAGNRFTASREKALTRKLKAIHEDLRYKIMSSGAYGVYNPDIKERKNLPHTNYDFEETDYPHE